MAVVSKTSRWLLVALLGVSALNQSAAADNHCETDLLSAFAGQDLAYRVEWKGLSLDSTRRIRQLEDGRWEAHNRSRLLFMSIEERSRFELDQGQILSQDYLYDRQGMSDKQDLKLDFASGHYQVTSPRGDGRLEAPEPVYDLLNHQLQMRIDLACQPRRTHYRYPVARRNRISDYDYRLVGEDSVTTPAGDFETVVLERGEPGDKLDRVWLAPALNYLIVRLVHQEDDETAELQLVRDPRLSPEAN